MLNIVALQGRLAADPEQRTTQNGTPVTSFSLAVQRNIKSGDEYPTDWIDCVAWKGTAEFICKYFQKGQLMWYRATLKRAKKILRGLRAARKWLKEHPPVQMKWEV